MERWNVVKLKFKPLATYDSRFTKRKGKKRDSGIMEDWKAGMME
jgi:hypothetical protein